ncbi:MAG: hypothetical protein HC821_01070 [Lewinella sp.]|nr:hypothetical protein [Lewinella sp.]
MRAESRHIHVIKMLDDNNSDLIISEGCRAIDYGIDREVQLMQHHLGVTDVHYYHISGTNFSRARLEEVLDEGLAYQERDIIFLVYAGHGYRELGSRSRFPKLYFNDYQNGLEFEELRQALIQKNPSLLLSLVVACNVTQLNQNEPPPFLPDGNPPPPPSGSPSVAYLEYSTLSPKGGRGVLDYRLRRAEPYFQLFADQTNYTKVVDLLSADQEFFTFITRDGGIFFSEVLYTFQEIFSDQRYHSWEEICTSISQHTVQRSAGRNQLQQPLCQYQIYFAAGPEVIAQRSMPPEECRARAQKLKVLYRVNLKALRHQHRLQMR